MLISTRSCATLLSWGWWDCVIQQPSPPQPKTLPCRSAWARCSRCVACSFPKLARFSTTTSPLIVIEAARAIKMRHYRCPASLAASDNSSHHQCDAGLGASNANLRLGRSIMPWPWQICDPIKCSGKSSQRSFARLGNLGATRRARSRRRPGPPAPRRDGCRGQGIDASDGRPLTKRAQCGPPRRHSCRRTIVRSPMRTCTISNWSTNTNDTGAVVSPRSPRLKRFQDPRLPEL